MKKEEEEKKGKDKMKEVRSDIKKSRSERGKRCKRG